MTQLEDVRQAVEAAGAGIVGLDVDAWAGWVIYLMEALERGVDPVDGFLAAIHRDLGQRIERGGW